MENKGALVQKKALNSAGEDDGHSISLQVLEFKTSLLEAVEELHIHRDAETRYEQQICKLVLEKQELEWQKDSFQSQISKMANENSEVVTAVKKQFQGQIQQFETEKSKNQLAAELKDKAITSLKEELKQLQLLRYSLEKKLSELEQKLQLQTQTKDSHLNQLGEVERRFAAISRQCTMIRQAHEKLEQNVEEAMRINKKLISINENQESAIKALKEDFERVNKELVTFKVSSACQPGEERLQDVLKEQQFQQIEQRLFVEIEMNKKLRTESDKERAEKQEVLKSLQHSLGLLQTQMDALCRTDQELSTLQEEYKVLKTEHESNQERTKEKDESFARLRDEYQNSKVTWEKEIIQWQVSVKADKEELIATKKAYSQLQEENKQLADSALQKVDDSQHTEADSPGTKPIEANPVKGNGLHENSKKSYISVHESGEQMCHSDKDVPDTKNSTFSSTAKLGMVTPLNFTQSEVQKDESMEVQEAEKHNSSLKDNAKPVEVDGEIILPSLPTRSNNLLNPEKGPQETLSFAKTNLSELCHETNISVCIALDKKCPLNSTQSDTDHHVSELSVPGTRSVYHIHGSPLALKPKDRQLEESLCISDVTKPQTSGKHMDRQGFAPSQSKQFKDQTTVPERLYNALQNESQTTSQRLSKDSTKFANTQDTVEFFDKMAVVEEPLGTQPQLCEETVQEVIEIRGENESKEDKNENALTQGTTEFWDKNRIVEGLHANQPDSTNEKVQETLENYLSKINCLESREDTVEIPNMRELQEFNDKGSIGGEQISIHQRPGNKIGYEDPETRVDSSILPLKTHVECIKGESENTTTQETLVFDDKGLVEEPPNASPTNQCNESVPRTNLDDAEELLQGTYLDSKKLQLRDKAANSILPQQSPSNEMIEDKVESANTQENFEFNVGRKRVGAVYPHLCKDTIQESPKTKHDGTSTYSDKIGLESKGDAEFQNNFIEELHKTQWHAKNLPEGKFKSIKALLDPQPLESKDSQSELISEGSQSLESSADIIRCSTADLSNPVDKSFFHKHEVTSGTFDSQSLKSSHTQSRASIDETNITHSQQFPFASKFTLVKDQSFVDQKNSSTSRYPPTFGLDMLMNWNKKPLSVYSNLEQRYTGLYELSSPFSAPLFKKDSVSKQSLTKLPDKLDTSSKMPLPKSDVQGEWNAVKQSFSEMLMQRENHMLISYGSNLNANPSSSPSSSMVGGLRQDYAPSVSPHKIQSLEKIARPVTFSSEGRDNWKQSDIMAQIAKIEEFMSSEGLLPAKRSKTE